MRENTLDFQLKIHFQISSSENQLLSSQHCMAVYIVGWVRTKISDEGFYLKTKLFSKVVAKAKGKPGQIYSSTTWVSRPLKEVTGT